MSMTKIESRPERIYDVCIVGGAGHVGLPLGLAFANAGLRVLLHDLNTTALAVIASGHMPFIEYEAQPVLESALRAETLSFSSDVAEIKKAKHVIIAIGTPVDEYLNPKLKAMLDLIETLHPHLDCEQTVIVRSTVYPTTCRQILDRLERLGGGPWHIAYCPERIAQGYAIRELKTLPQLISGLDEVAMSRVSDLFLEIAPTVIAISVEEAELAKLFSNAWRYIQFAAANQFYMMASDFNVDFNRVRLAMVKGYGRASNLPSAGFAAGPCLLKDTMQLAAFSNQNFMLGQAAMNVNEGLPAFIVRHLSAIFNLSKTRVGILGMAFKGDIDDTRDSLSYKLGKILRFHGADVAYSDEFARDPTFCSKEDIILSCSVIIVGAPHSAYRKLSVPENVYVVDLWGVLSAE